jgi:hypothetical protein
LRRKLDDPKRPGVLVPVTTFHKFLRNSASRPGSVSPGVLCYSGCQPQKERARSPGSLQVVWSRVERAQQYGAICAPELSYCGMQPGSCGPANDAVAALSASAAPNPRAPRYLMTRVFMVVLHSSACVKAEEREGVVRLSRSPIPRSGRNPNPPGNCPPPASHDAGWQKRERWPMRSSPKQAPIRFWSSCSSPFAGLAT